MNTPMNSPWHHDPIEVDRYLDSEGADAERAARAAELEADPEAAARIAARERWLQGLAKAGAPTGAALNALAMPAGLERRIREALQDAAATPAAHAHRAPRRLLTYAAAAVVLVAVGLITLLSESSTVEAMPPEVLDARAALMDLQDGIGGCRENAITSPHAFPGVRDGALSVSGCEETAEGKLLGRLRGERETTVAGFVARAESGTNPSHRIGKTILGDVVVFDIHYGDATAFIAAKRSVVAAHGSCVVCHNRSREGLKNPHDIVLRTWKRPESR